MSTYVITISKKWWYTKITWIMGVGRVGLRHRSTSPNTINTFSNIEPVIVIYLFRPTSTSCTTTSTISSLEVRVAGLLPISNSPTNAKRISWKSQQSNTFTLLIGGIVAVLISISTSPFNINYLPQLREEEWLVSCDLDPTISTYPPLLREEEWLVKLELCPRPTKLLEEEWMISRDLCPQLSRPPQLIEEDCLVSRELCPWLY